MTPSPYAVPGLKDAKYNTVGSVASIHNMPVPFITSVVCSFFKIPDTNLSSKRRSRMKFVWPRHVFCWLCKKYTLASLNRIGEVTNRDHSTVIHSVDVIEEAHACSKNYPDPLWALAEEVEKALLDKIKETQASTLNNVA